MRKEKSRPGGENPGAAYPGKGASVDDGPDTSESCGQVVCR